MITLSFNGISERAADLAASSSLLPIWGLREPVRELIEDVTQGYQTQRDFALMSLFSAVGCRCASTYSRFASYVNHPTFYIVLVGNSSSGKTEQLGFFFQPIEDEEDRSFDLYKMEKQVFESTPKKERGTPPIFHHQLINDASDESVLKELARNKSICWHCDELRTMFESWGRYTSNGSGGVIVGHLLSIHNHKSITITRASEDAQRIPKPLLNIIGGIQPKTLVRTIGGKGYTEDGLFQRFLFVYPQTKPTPFVVENPVTDELRQRWGDMLSSIKQSSEEELEIRETDGAREWHKLILQQWEKRCREEFAQDEVSESLLRKFAIHLCSLSIAVALINESHYITPDHIRYAAHLCEALFRYSVKVLNLIEPPSRDEQHQPTRREVAEAIKRFNPEASATEIGKVLGVSRQAISKYDL